VNLIRLGIACDHGAAMAENIAVRGLFETHLTVRDLGRSVAFYRDVVGLALALEVPERGAAFFWVGGPGEAMLGLWSLGSAPMGLSLHVAFRASLEDVMDACEACDYAVSHRSRSSRRKPRSRASSAGCRPLPCTFATPTATCSSTWRCSTTSPVQTAG